MKRDSTTKLGVRPPRQRVITGRLVGKLLALVLLAVAQMMFLGPRLDAQILESGYGRRLGREYDQSVNGTAALVELLQRRGHKVKTWGRMSPRIDNYQTLIWMPDRMEVPTEEARQRLERWLSEGYSRTLIYVARDYDAAVTYWATMLGQANSEDRDIIRRELSRAKSRHASLRAAALPKEDAGWFQVERTVTRRRVTTLEGPLSQGIDVAKTRIFLESRISGPANLTTGPAPDARWEVLLASQGDPIVGRYTNNWRISGGGQILIVANGSFLLNLGLVNHENRALADQLFNEIPRGGSVMFLESGPEPIEVIDRDWNDDQPTPWDWVSVWPLNWIVPHLFMIGVICCFAFFPIFGRPQEIEEDRQGDFGKHLSALGQLLAKTEDSKYMLDRIKYYQEHVRRESGISHAAQTAEEILQSAERR